MTRSRPNYGRCTKRVYCYLDDHDDDNGTTQPLPIDIDLPLDLPHHGKANIAKC
jgi:hypothetical protein